MTTLSCFFLQEQSDVNRTSQFTSNSNQVVRSFLFCFPCPFLVTGLLDIYHQFLRLNFHGSNYIIQAWTISYGQFSISLFHAPPPSWLAKLPCGTEDEGTVYKSWFPSFSARPFCSSIENVAIPICRDVDKHGCSGRHWLSFFLTSFLGRINPLAPLKGSREHWQLRKYPTTSKATGPGNYFQGCNYGLDLFYCFCPLLTLPRSRHGKAIQPDNKDVILCAKRSGEKVALLNKFSMHDNEMDCPVSGFLTTTHHGLIF